MMGRPRTLRQSLPGLRRVVSVLWPYLRRHRAMMGGSVLSLLAAVALNLLEPWPLKFVFDRVLHQGHGGLARLPVLERLDSLEVLAIAALALVVIVGLRAVAEYFSTVSFALIGNRVLTQVRDDLFRHLQRLPLSFHTKSRGGDLIVRVINDVNMLKDVTVTAVLPLAASVLVLLGMFGLMFYLNWQLALLSLSTMPVLWFSGVRLTRRIREAGRRQRERQSALASTAAESMTAIKIVQALSLESVFANQFIGRSRTTQRQDVKGARLAARLARTVDLLAAISTALVLYFGARLVLQAPLSFSAGDLLVFLAYLKKAFNPLQDFAKYTARLAKASAAGDRIVELLEREPEIRDLPGAVDAPPFSASIEFRGVTFGYDRDRHVFEHIQFEVLPRQQIALVGPSGIGKSTIVNLLLRLYDPVQGEILIDGIDIRQFTLASLRSQISVVLQDNLLFAGSLRENIAFGFAGATLESVELAARLANAHDFIARLPQGYETQVGERGVTLSHGQRQRIAIARAAIRQAPILILDEPTTGLDEENARDVVEALERVASARTTLVISHDLDLAARADLIVYLENGQVLEQGSHLQLMQLDGRYAALYKLQAAMGDRRDSEESHAFVR